jgi:hypothetical protein
MTTAYQSRLSSPLQNGALAGFPSHLTLSLRSVIWPSDHRTE